MTTGAALFAAEACMGSHPRAANAGGAVSVRSAPIDESTHLTAAELRDPRSDHKPSDVEKTARLRADNVDQAR